MGRYYMAIPGIPCHWYGQRSRPIQVLYIIICSLSSYLLFLVWVFWSLSILIVCNYPFHCFTSLSTWFFLLLACYHPLIVLPYSGWYYNSNFWFHGRKWYLDYYLLLPNPHTFKPSPPCCRWCMSCFLLCYVLWQWYLVFQLTSLCTRFHWYFEKNCVSFEI